MKTSKRKKTTDHSFKITLSAAEEARLAAYVRESGIKIMALMRKALLHYLDRVGA